MEHEQGIPNAGTPGWTTGSAATAGVTERPYPLRRPWHGRMFAGVAAGIADHFGIDVTIVRVVLVALTIAGGAGVPLYLAGWLLIPDEGTDRSIAAEWMGRAY
jgi:phage shock protein PspC (stress-responsive transcriptional regulator)